jgi:hypothetical protein
MMSAETHGPVANQSSAQDRELNSNQQMVICQSTYSLCIADTPQQASHIRQTPHEVTYAEQVPHQAIYMQ